MKRVKTDETLRQQNLYLAALHETMLGVMNRLDLNELLESIVSRAPAPVGASFGWLYLYDPATDTMSVRFGTGEIRPYIGIRLRRGEGLAGRIWQLGAALAVEDYQAWETRSAQFPQGLVHSAMGTPLIFEGQTIGVLGVSQTDTRRIFGPAEIETLTRFAQLAVIALDNARLYAEARENEQRYRTVVNTMGQGLAIADTHGKLIYANPALARMLGRQAEALIGMTPEGLVCQEDLPILDQVRRRQGQDEAFSFELRLRRADGSLLHAMITNTPRYRNDQIAGIVAVITDLTDIKHAEEALAQARDQAVQASKLKSEFLASMSHEVRTPLSSILGMNELLLETTLTDEQRRYASTVQESAQALLTILDDVLDLSRIEAGELRLSAEEFQPVEVIEKAVDLFHSKARKKGIALSVQIAPDAPAWLKGDPGRLRQIIINLLSNAIKFTEAGQVDVRVYVAQRSEGRILLRHEVCDTGIGLSSVARQRLFVPFAIGDAAQAELNGGVGLGLSISKRLVELMGGQIGGYNNPERGATFWFTAWFTPTDPGGNAANTQPSNGRGQTRQQILLVEDHPANRELAVAQIECLGYTVRAVAEGGQAIAAYREAPDAYALILIDCQMPEMDGLSATRRIREVEAGTARHVPIVAMTANTDPRDRGACLVSGMDGFLSKPVQRDELALTLARWLGEPMARPPAHHRAIAAPRRNGPIDAQQKLSGTSVRRLDASAPAIDPRTVTGLHEWRGHLKEAVIDELVTLFLGTTAGLLGDLRAAVVRGDAPTTRSLAHSIRGSASSLGALSLSGLAYELELTAENGDAGLHHDLLRQLEDEFMRVQAALTTPRPAAAALRSTTAHPSAAGDAPQ